MASIGIVIPALNEEKNIANCLRSLESFQRMKDFIVVSDAGSQDRTVEIAETFGITVIHSPQQARGMVISHGVNFLLQNTPSLDFILIAHADMIFPSQARACLQHALQKNSNIIGGCFGHKIQSHSFFLHLVEWGNHFRARWLGMSYGDQAQFFCPPLLEKAGGFPRQPHLEDVELSFRMKKVSTPLYLNCPVGISGRHWRKGIVKTTLRNWGIVLGYILSKPRRKHDKLASSKNSRP